MFVSPRSQLRSTVNLVKEQSTVQSDFQCTLKELFRGQLPSMVSNVVEGQANVIMTSVDETSLRSAQRIEENVRMQIIQEVTTMLESVVEEVVERVSDNLNSAQPVWRELQGTMQRESDLQQCILVAKRWKSSVYENFIRLQINSNQPEKKIVWKVLRFMINNKALIGAFWTITSCHCQPFV